MLTYRDEDGCVRIEGCDSSNMEDMLRRCIDRLYEYESVGLTPEGVRKALRELKALKKAEEGTAQAVDCAAVAELFQRDMHRASEGEGAFLRPPERDIHGRCAASARGGDVGGVLQARRLLGIFMREDRLARLRL